MVVLMMNNIITKNWKLFKLEDVFDKLEDGKCKKAALLNNGSDCWYLGAKKNDACHIRQTLIDNNLISEGNCIALICDGQGSIGYSNYIPNGKYIGTVNLRFAYSKFLNEDNALFLVTVLDKERYKYSFGRKYKTKMKDILIKLPSDKNGNPDFQYMTTYIQKLKNKAIFKKIYTANNKNTKFDISDWRLFKITDLFNIKGYGSISSIELEGKGIGEYPYVTRTEQNNGISGFYDYKTAPKNVLTIETTLSGLCFYHDYEFSTGDHIMVLEPKEGVILNKYTAMFIKTIWRKNAYKYDYNRPAIKENIVKTSLILPSKNGKPDWEYMEKFIKKLPYGDLI